MKNEAVNRSIALFFLTGVLPLIVGFIPIVGWVLMNLYIRPIIIAGYLLGDYEMFLHVDIFVTYPRGIGFVIGIIFWGLLGLLLSYITSRVIKNNSKSGNLLITLLLTILVGFGLSAITSQIGKKITQADNEAKANFLVEHCKRINLDGYYFNKCDDNTLKVPDEYTNKFLADESRSVTVLRSFDRSIYTFNLCVKDGSKIFTPESEGRICEKYYGNWPKLPMYWEFDKFRYDISLKTYDISIVNTKNEDGYYTIHCTEKSEYCTHNQF